MEFLSALYDFADDLFKSVTGEGKPRPSGYEWWYHDGGQGAFEEEHIDPTENEPRPESTYVECSDCRGSGASGRGEGYAGMCDRCGGTGQVTGK